MGPGFGRGQSGQWNGPEGEQEGEEGHFGPGGWQKTCKTFSTAQLNL